MKKFFFYFLSFFICLHLLLFFTQKTWLYNGVRITYLKGYSSAYIHDFVHFSSDTIFNLKHQPWLFSSDYNSYIFPDSFYDLNDSLETTAFLVIKNDSIKYEYYSQGYSEDSASNSFSMAKSFISALIGIAITDGLIKNVDVPVCDFIPEFCGFKKQQITIKHLLTMSSGLQWDEDYKNPFGNTAEAYYGNDLRSLVLNKPVVEDPGKTFRYYSSSTQILSYVLESATKKTISKYASEKLWGPIGAKNIALWAKDQPLGDEKAFCCIASNARDFARLGKLFLSNGVWGRNRIIDSNYVSAAIRPSDLKKNYGYHFWITEYNGLYVYYARGLYGQYIICIPEKDLVVVRLGKKWKSLLKNGHHMDLYDFIGAALKITN